MAAPTIIMSALAAAAAPSGGRGSGTSSWPPMRRPAATNKHGASASTGRGASTIMNYVAAETTEISTRRDLGGSDDALIGAIWDPTPVDVTNARLLLGGEDEMRLDANGFELRSTEEGEMVAALKGMDFCDQERVVGEYYPRCEKLVKDAIMSQASSAPIACVCAFDHNVRSSDRASVGEILSTRQSEDGESKAAAAPQVQNPAGLVHADYTRTSAPRRLNDLSKPPKMNDVLRPTLLAQNRSSLLDPTMVQEALDGKRRYAFVNVWRSIDPEHPVSNPPLACIDAATATVDDLRTFKIHYVDRVGENYFACHPTAASSSSASDRRRHEWYFYPDMTINEALLLKQWDSKGGMARGSHSDAGGLSTFTIHSAFLDPSCSSDSPPRKSIEVRCVVIWEKDE